MILQVVIELQQTFHINQSVLNRTLMMYTSSSPKSTLSYIARTPGWRAERPGKCGRKSL